MSEYERVDRLQRRVTVEDVHQLSGASTPHFALHIRNRIRNLIRDLPADDPARIAGEREIGRLERIAEGSERRGEQGHGEPPMPSLRDGEPV